MTNKTFLHITNNSISLIVGLVLVLIIGILTYSILVGKREATQKSTETETSAVLPKTHTVADGESLWTIALTYYKSGYNWIDIAKSNSLENPDYIVVGQQLIIPDTKPIIVESGQISATSTVAPKHKEVTVTQGDTLWDIAVREYGSGYKWTDIAGVNAIANPDLIYPNTLLRLE